MKRFIFCEAWGNANQKSSEVRNFLRRTIYFLKMETILNNILLDSFWLKTEFKIIF